MFGKGYGAVVGYKIAEPDGKMLPRNKDALFSDKKSVKIITRGYEGMVVFEYYEGEAGRACSRVNL